MLSKDENSFSLQESMYSEVTEQGQVVQSIVSLTSSLRSQLVNCFTILLHNTLIFFAQKNQRSFAMQKRLTFVSTKKFSIYF